MFKNEEGNHAYFIPFVSKLDNKDGFQMPISEYVRYAMALHREMKNDPTIRALVGHCSEFIQNCFNL